MLKNSNVKKLFFEVISSELIFKFHFVEPALDERVISGFNKLLEKDIVLDFPNICSRMTVLEAIKVNDFEQVRAINFGEVHILNKIKRYSFAILNCIWIIYNTLVNGDILLSRFWLRVLNFLGVSSGIYL